MAKPSGDRTGGRSGCTQRKHAPQTVQQGIDLFRRVIEGGGNPQGVFLPQRAQQRLSAVVAGADGDAQLIQQNGNIIGGRAVYREGEAAASAAGLTQNVDVVHRAQSLFQLG